ncbi:MAG: hypothetical protein WC663_00260 [Patescibacteria group bacterium]|jgi:hypothetical protein
MLSAALLGILVWVAIVVFCGIMVPCGMAIVDRKIDDIKLIPGFTMEMAKRTWFVLPIVIVCNMIFVAALTFYQTGL